jgi:RluA family pseudouridine synthase
MPLVRSDPRTYQLSCEVDPYRDGWTLERFLSHRFRYHPSPIWVERMAAGAVRLNGVTAGPDAVVRKGDRIEYTVVHAEPEVDFRYEVLHRDETVLAVAKSGNIPVHAGGKYICNTLITRLREDFGEGLRPAHRLDRETSGVIVLARTRKAAAAFERQFRGRRVRKRYLAVVRGTAPEEITVDAAIVRREPPEPPYFRAVTGEGEGGKAAVTRFRRLRTGTAAAPPHEPISLVEAAPESGRTNQIRVHAAHAGFPILGDKVYGVPEAMARAFVTSGPTDEIEAAAGAPRHLLHCAELDLTHPATGEPLRLRAPVPPDFAAAWRDDDDG